MFYSKSSEFIIGNRQTSSSCVLYAEEVAVAAVATAADEADVVDEVSIAAEAAVVDEAAQSCICLGRASYAAQLSDQNAIAKQNVSACC